MPSGARGLKKLHANPGMAPGSPGSTRDGNLRWECSRPDAVRLRVRPSQLIDDASVTAGCDAAPWSRSWEAMDVRSPGIEFGVSLLCCNRWRVGSAQTSIDEYLPSVICPEYRVRNRFRYYSRCKRADGPAGQIQSSPERRPSWCVSHITGASRTVAMCKWLVVSSGWSVASRCHRMLGTARMRPDNWPTKPSMGTGPVGDRKSIPKTESHCLKCLSGRFLASGIHPIGLRTSRPRVRRHALLAAGAALRYPRCPDSEGVQGSAMCVGDYPPVRPNAP